MQGGSEENQVEPSEKEAILLGLIAEGPVHAYRLEEKIRLRRMTDWTSISSSSIYRVLGQLTDRGWIDTNLEHEGQGATRKVHAITPSGRAALGRAVAHYLSDLQSPKSPFQVALAFLTNAPREEILAKLTARDAMVQQILVELDQVLQLAHGAIGATPDAAWRDAQNLHAELLFSHIRMHLEAERAFIRSALARLASIPDTAFNNQPSFGTEAKGHGG
jgi:DNA-binding PadR family transcriptional regulator